MAYSHGASSVGVPRTTAFRASPDATGKDAGNIGNRSLPGLFALCCCCYLAVYSLEAPARYLLYLLGKDSLILARDGLMILPVVALFVTQLLHLRLQPVFIVAGLVVAFHGLVLIGTVGSLGGVAYGAKILINLLFGFFVASILISPKPRIFRLLALLWVVVLIGVCLDKFVMTFPWTGIRTVIGDLNVDVSRDWQISNPMARRVAGFTRSSIAVASIVPCLAIVLMCKVRQFWLRGLIGFLSVGAVFLTTQKGALIAFVPVAAILCLEGGRILRLRLCYIAFLMLAMGLPLLTLGLHMSHGAGVFSTESFYLRIAYTWPDAIHWIERHQMLWFGVGLGGIGGPQRLYAPDNFNPADNLFLLLYGYFGVFALLYTAYVSALALRPVTGLRERVEPALAVLAFAVGYGAVLSVIEDQASSLFLGAAIGVLWRETAAGRPFGALSMTKAETQSHARQPDFATPQRRHFR